MAERQIVIIGGGFSGTALAIHLARRGTTGLKVVIIEPRAQLAQGVAYGTLDPAHRINVPAARMQLSDEEEGDFDRWFRASVAFKQDVKALRPDGSLYPQRGQFGRYIAEKLATALTTSAVQVIHVQDYAVALRHGVVLTASGHTYPADDVVLAISHPPPAVPKQLQQTLKDHPGLIANPWLTEALSEVGNDDRVAIIGTGLTMSDVVASLHRQGHRGPILAFSRRGQLPRPNLSGDYAVRQLDYQRPQAATARGWLRRIRQEVALANAEHQPWQRVLDDIRLNGQQIWQQWSLQEQRRFLRHLRPWWDVHRYRIAPQVSDVLTDMQQNGQLEVLAASLKQVSVDNTVLALTLKARGRTTTETRLVDKLIVTTGPAHGALLQSDALLKQLTSEGIIQPDPLALGIWVDACSRAMNRQNQSNEHLFVVGPAARGRFGELMGLPQVAQHAESLAQQLLSPLRSENQ
ncbi:tRNA 5-methylaminomethyl-2-thiouridine biosynthesis bifunctional protein MnmC [Serratia grimesii]|uniref:FAD/NAD(P)-binding protein n=1 Tax=Serratia grimesii TaxID=82995 RepID=UPI00076F374B|nr:FAD-dependent oxidoreductase [Serratia grimesii]CUW07716.1 tRNA 5-methylaminomethyl-2-thiouridine biosynthesis bifunctional protein MnmC [Serratia grimesii]SMZ55739.1 tRNA 5-methylaminomethyl-2-thiouridine biosynthesis bifunctional protein MnmC [Serratia grimesii]